MIKKLLYKNIILFILICAIITSNIALFHLNSNAVNKEIAVSSAVTNVDSNNRFKVIVSFSNNSGIMGYKMLFFMMQLQLIPYRLFKEKILLRDN